MNIHKNARLTPKDRVHLVLQHRLTYAIIAEHMDLSSSTVARIWSLPALHGYRTGCASSAFIPAVYTQDQRRFIQMLLRE